jgi:hypothetical protein
MRARGMAYVDENNMCGHCHELQAVIERLQRELNEAHGYVYRMEGERDTAEERAWNAENPR